MKSRAGSLECYLQHVVKGYLQLVVDKLEYSLKDYIQYVVVIIYTICCR